MFGNNIKRVNKMENIDLKFTEEEDALADTIFNNFYRKAQELSIIAQQLTSLLNQSGKIDDTTTFAMVKANKKIKEWIS